MSGKRAYWAAAIAGLLMAPGFGVGPSFIPDTSFKGSNLGGWHTLGQADWHAENGEIRGAAKAGGGWLVLDRSYQDVASRRANLDRGDKDADSSFPAT